MATKFGITKDTKGGVKAPFPVTSQTPFHQAYLTNVEYTLKKLEKGKDAGKEKGMLVFSFSSPDKTKQHIQSYFELDTTHQKFDKMLDIFNQRIKHIYEAFATLTEEGIGGDAETFRDYMKNIADAFNRPTKKTEGEGDDAVEVEVNNPIYLNKKVWLYLTYNDRGRLEIPFPNFIEIENNNNKTKPLTLFVKDKDVVDKPVSKSTARPGSDVSAGEDDIPEEWGG